MTPKKGENQPGVREKVMRAKAARKRQQVARCYREHTPPQIRELRRAGSFTGTEFVPWERSTVVECECGKRFGSNRFLKKHKWERCQVGRTATAAA